MAMCSVGSAEQKILCLGACVLDIVQICNQYPLEDSDQRSIECRWQRGGNASNTCTVLSLLGRSCEFLGSFSSEEHLNFLQNDMKKYNIDHSHCQMVKGIGCPISTITLSLSSGSRTILHHNPNMPELTFEIFQQLCLDDYSWIHFEGRNVAEVSSMMQHVINWNESSNRLERNVTTTQESTFIAISVELERDAPELLSLLRYADVVFISREFAESRGYDDMSETIRNISKEAKSGATIICAWSDKGATACTPNGITVRSPAFPPCKIIDTLGAGDTFNAAVLYYLNKAKLDYIKKKREELGNKIEESDAKSLRCGQIEFIDQAVLHKAVTFGCTVAGAKVGLKGYDGLKQLFRNTVPTNKEFDVNCKS